MLLTGLLVIICLFYSASSVAKIRDWTTEEFACAFDEVARNYGAAEYATYTFMLEFGRSPESFDELRDSGHLNVLMVNPYTQGEVLSLTDDDYPDGDLAGNVYLSSPRENGEEAHLEAWYLRRDDQEVIVQRSMVKRIFIYFSSVDYNYLFGNDLPCDEQFTAVYCRQVIDALESFEQRNGRSPDDFDDMYENGDVNVHYINPIMGEVVVSSEELSPGNYYYEKIGDDGFCFIGWGRERPVFFACTDEEAALEFYLEWPELIDEDIDPDDSENADEDQDETPGREGAPGCKI